MTSTLKPVRTSKVIIWFKDWHFTCNLCRYGKGPMKKGGETNKVPAEVLAAMGATAADLLAQFPAQVGPMLAGMPAEHQAALKQHMGGATA